MKKSDFLIEGKSSRKFIFAHGAGAPMDSDWMNEISNYLVQHKIEVIRFEFPYMQQRRTSGKKSPPGSALKLISYYKEVLNYLGNPKDFYIGGKSMGGRIASLLCDELKVKGLICLGFPFHAPGKDPKDRIDHLKELKTKTLILQGERDSMGSIEEVKKYKLSKKIKIHWLEDGDHSLKPRKKSGYDLKSHLETSALKINKFMS